MQGKRSVVADVLSRIQERENTMGKRTHKILATFKNSRVRNNIAGCTITTTD